MASSREAASRGLIPAHAGKTPSTKWAESLAWAHPRSRGENSVDEMGRVAGVGSSPLTRGKLPVAVGSTVSGRLIPAHAGKTPSLSSSSSSSSAHPRSRGENRTLWPGNHAGVGSSPLTRGKRGACGWAAGRTRLIPAHAGKTRRGMPTTRSRPAHPRSRGENRLVPCPFSLFGGSSPLTRGKHRRSARTARQRGLIPAHAGKTAHL